MDNKKYINRELSWLSFNERVLQETIDRSMPLFQRIRFLGIYSSNRDEFFRVRVASVRRMIRYKKKKNILIGYENPEKILKEIQRTVAFQQRKFERIYMVLLSQLSKYNIFVIDEKQLTPDQEKFVANYYQENIKPFIVPIMVRHTKKFPTMRDKTIYFMVKLYNNEEEEQPEYALIDLATDMLPRFVELPSGNGKKFIMILDDVIRYGLKDIFSIFNYKHIEAYTIKVTRDAELDHDEDINKSFVEIMEESLAKRKIGEAVRFVYDSRMPEDLLSFVSQKMKFHKRDDLVAGGKYHNFKDFIKFPKSPYQELEAIDLPPVPCPALDKQKSILKAVKQADVMLHYPYQSFHYFVDLLREASILPEVVSIKITLYRVASNSQVINTLINAARNGKSVTVVMELQARFDEENNIYWSNKLQEEGIKVIHGVQGLKVHSKLALITSRKGDDTSRLAYIGTGNFQEDTAKIYSDIALMTSHKEITEEVAKVFSFFRRNYEQLDFKHLISSPFSTRDHFTNLIQQETENAVRGQRAEIYLKLNSLVDPEMISHLYAASRAGVKIKLMVRGICSLRAGVEGLSENIETRSIVDRYLEHARVLYFYAGGKEHVYIASADWMNRNLDRRIEITCPIYDEEIRQELLDYLEIQWRDNSKARILGSEQVNTYVEAKVGEFRAQTDFYEYLKRKYSTN